MAYAPIKTTKHDSLGILRYDGDRGGMMYTAIHAASDLILTKTSKRSNLIRINYGEVNSPSENGNKVPLFPTLSTSRVSGMDKEQ